MHSSLMDRISDAIAHLAEGETPPSRARIARMFPGVETDRLHQCYRAGCMDLVLSRHGRPLDGSTAADRSEVQARIEKLRAWKIAQGDRPVPSVRVPWRVPRTRMPVRLELFHEGDAA
jgi:hypothetical protein